MKLALIDYGSGNLRSVQKALEICGGRPELVASADQIDDAAAIVVPGVGAFGDCAANLQRTGLWEPIKNWIHSGRPYLGICLGYQLLFEGSEESPGVPGLGILAGRVRRFTSLDLKIPHMGWNTLERCDSNAPVLYRNLPEPLSVYFVHSYFPEPDDPAIVSARCEYGESFAASISRGNLHAVQFHPEKSQRTGLAILQNFIESL